VSLSYNFQPGRILAKKYQVVAPLGSVREGEIYALSECATGIERTAKFFYPHVDPLGRVATIHAQKLHKLRHCPILMQYRTQETISIGGAPVTFLVSDFVRGELLGDFLARQPGRRLEWFEALHLLLATARGVELMHGAGEAAGPLRRDNVMVRRVGLGFQVKLMELATAGRVRPEHRRDDTHALLRLFHDVIAGGGGGKELPRTVRELLGTPRRPKLDGFRDAGELRAMLEQLRW
jgi:hypothetical protein